MMCRYWGRPQAETDTPASVPATANAPVSVTGYRPEQGRGGTGYSGHVESDTVGKVEKQAAQLWSRRRAARN
jgi:hypothetical protein